MHSSSWLFDEFLHAGSEHLDPAYVATYDRKARTDPSDDLARLRSLGLKITGTLVDFGAGTGTFALAAAPICRRVVAVDASPAMLARLQERAAASGLTTVETVRSGFLTYTWLLEPLLERAGFRIQETEYLSPVFAAYVCSKR